MESQDLPKPQTGCVHWDVMPRSSGSPQGFSNGLALGLSIGLALGFNIGLACGFNAGFTRGLSMGFIWGFKKCGWDGSGTPNGSNGVVMIAPFNRCYFQYAPSVPQGAARVATRITGQGSSTVGPVLPKIRWLGARIAALLHSTEIEGFAMIQHKAHETEHN